jgi:hypothetical protein
MAEVVRSIADLGVVVAFKLCRGFRPHHNSKIAGVVAPAPAG